MTWIYRQRWAHKLNGYSQAGIVPFEQFQPGVSAGELLTTVEDGSRGDLSEQIYNTLQIITGD
jgi:hypothetical protein